MVDEAARVVIITAVRGLEVATQLTVVNLDFTAATFSSSGS